ncbi:DNRLRE domain-containing protein [Paenibacillus xylanexedens]|uniref:DNRLRE domain-containing protein n=1 Tax=Paenibacillus xylanexedens TaxID=528191 RepID=UPI0011A5BA99|nr:DNRLRE domain-containing protein [Paenibacillus xylanexedens]
MYYDDHDTEGIIYVKSPSNRFTSKYVLYVQDIDGLDSELVVATRQFSTLESSVSVKSSVQHKDISSTLDIMYRGYGDLESSIEATMFTEMPSMINVRPHNRAQGKFELIEAPRTNIELKPIGDATTRSRIDLQTINYGDTQRMMIGHDTVEEFESFVNFGDIKVAIPDLLYLEDAKLRLYYTGTIKSGANIEIYQPSTLWREYGITYANKPSATEMFTNQYTINAIDKYIEINVLDVLKRWQDGSLINYGLNIRSNDGTPIYFNTRESSKPPILQVRYITSAVQSYGRLDVDASLFVYKRGIKDLSSSLYIKSDRGWNYFDSSLYVHRYEDPMFNEFNSFIGVSRPDVNSSLTVAIRTQSDLNSYISIIEDGITESDSSLTISTPDLLSSITIDPKMSLASEISIANRSNVDLTGSIVVSSPDLPSYLDVSDYSRIRLDFEAKVSIRNEIYDDYDSFVALSNPDLNSGLNVREIGQYDLESYVNVTERHYQDAYINVSRPDLLGELYVRGVYTEDLGSYVNVKANHDFEGSVSLSRPDINGYFNVRAIEHSDLESYVNVRATLDYDSSIAISRPDISSSIQVRAISHKDLDSYVNVKANLDYDSTIGISRPDVFSTLYIRAIENCDLNSYISVPAVEDYESSVGISRPDLHSALTVKYISDQDSYIYIKNREYLDGVIDIRQINDLESTIMIKQIAEFDSSLAISRPDLVGFLYPRVNGLHDTDSIVSIRKRDVSDMNSSILIRGVSSGAYYYIL